MPRLGIYIPSPQLVLGSRVAARVPESDQQRQRAEVDEILRRLRSQPGVILADEVGMGKTFVALGVAYSVAQNSPRGPVILMVPANLVDKWEQDLKTFCELYVRNARPVRKDDDASPKTLRAPEALRYGIARHSVELMKLLDDAPSERCHLIFIAQGAMARQQSDRWIRLALIGEALRRHARGGGRRLIQVKAQIHRFIGPLIRGAIGEEQSSEWREGLCERLLRVHPSGWRDIYNRALREGRQPLRDDPVPKSVVRAIDTIELRQLADILEQMPVRARGGTKRVAARVATARQALREIEHDLWKQLLAAARWRSPLLVMDEAHHLKNPTTALARQLQSPDSAGDLRTGDGAMAHAFDRMLFLTATPFQLGHHELVRVLERFGDVRWVDDPALGERQEFDVRLKDLGESLTQSQRTAIALQRAWTRLRAQDGPSSQDSDCWWADLQRAASEDVTPRQHALLDAFAHAADCRHNAQRRLRPWVIRHNKPECWSGTAIRRRQRFDGTRIIDGGPSANGGLDVPPTQLLPFFLAARSAAAPGQDLLGEALCSSYEAFRFTRERRAVQRDSFDDDNGNGHAQDGDLTASTWYLDEFDAALAKCTGSIHPKVIASVQRTVDLWERGEKVLLFAFYRQTCRALRIHISSEIERRMMELARRRLGEAGRTATPAEVERVLESIQNRYFDRPRARGRHALDRALHELMHKYNDSFAQYEVSKDQQTELLEVMRRFLRVTTTLVRCFPIHAHDSLEPDRAVREMLDSADASGFSWRRKFELFLDYLLTSCPPSEREAYLEAALRTQTGEIRVEVDEEDFDPEEADGDADKTSVTTLANVQVATGVTRREARSRLMRAFNTPFFPDILVCSQVMGEGVDLQRCCRHVIHHDLAWNPSSIEQRTGRIDRLGCKAEGHQPICVYLPYISGTADERQYKVMCERESWFRVVMGQDAVAKLIRPDDDGDRSPLPTAISHDLAFHLGLPLPTMGATLETLQSLIEKNITDIDQEAGGHTPTAAAYAGETSENRKESCRGDELANGARNDAAKDDA